MTPGLEFELTEAAGAYGTFGLISGIEFASAMVLGYVAPLAPVAMSLDFVWSLDEMIDGNPPATFENELRVGLNPERGLAVGLTAGWN